MSDLMSKNQNIHNKYGRMHRRKHLPHGTNTLGLQTPLLPNNLGT